MPRKDSTNVPTRSAFWKTMPLSSHALFFSGVFSLFASIGMLILLMGNQYLPPMEIFLTVLISGGFAMVYAWAGISRKIWLIVVLGAFEGLLFALLRGYYHESQILIQSGSPLHNQVVRITLASILAVIAGYVLFVIFFRQQGSRYYRAQTEITLASEIHRALVPQIQQTLGSFELFGASVPSGEIGGDLVDVTGNANSWIAYVADVSGHGVSAGLLMAMFKTAVRTRATGGTVQSLLQEVHRALYPLKTNNMFVTAGFLQYRNDGQLSLSLAGHPAMLHYHKRTNAVSEHPTLDLPLGILPEQTFSAAPVTCEAGDILLLLTDGLTEVFDKHGNELGAEAIKAALAKFSASPLPDLFAEIRRVALRAGRQDDDQTMLLVRIRT